MNSGWRIKEEPGKEKVGPTLREVPPPAEGKFGRLGANQELYLGQCVRASGGSQNKRGALKLGAVDTQETKTQGEKGKGVQRRRQRGRRGIEGLTACVSQWLHPSRLAFEVPVTVAIKWAGAGAGTTTDLQCPPGTLPLAAS